MPKATPDPAAPVETPAPAEPAAPAETPAPPADDPGDGIVRYAGLIAKYNAAGDYVLSDHLAPGERRVPGA